VVTSSDNATRPPAQEPAAQLPDEAQGPSANESEMSAGEQRSVNQLRAVAEAITNCSESNVPPDADMQAEGFSDVYGPPQNVVWNVIVQPSIRTRYEGYIEFGVPSYSQMPVDDSYCNKPRINKKECRERWEIGMKIYQHQVDSPLRFRYEFDVTDHGIEFLKALKKTKQMANEPWVEDGLKADGCAYKGIQSVLANPDAVENRTPTKQKGILEVAADGDADAQFTLGIMYAGGVGFPQNYAEAYFWLDLAASAKSDPLAVKARDEAASHLTPAVLLDTQKRAQAWFEAHGNTNK